MLAIVVAAGLCASLAQLLTFQLPLWWMAVPCLFFLVGRWLWSWRCRRIAAAGFVGLSLVGNLLYVAAAIYPDYMLRPLLRFGWMVVLFPLIGALGVAWAYLATEANASPQRSPFGAWSLVVILAVMPEVTLATLWPLHLAFLAFRPRLEQLADRVETGLDIHSPLWVGPFRLTASAVDKHMKAVGLFIDPNPNGRTGFVRVRSETPEGDHFDLLIGTDTNVELGRGWTYRQDD
jgi:hypothetical protein